MERARPRHYLQWHITHLCNLRCRHCYQDDFTGHLPAVQFHAALEQYLHFTGRRALSPQINLTGGEPLLHPSMFDFAEAIKSAGAQFAVLTNGTLITEENAKDLAALHPVFVQVSLDGNRLTHDAIRGEGNFQKALNGVDLLKKHGVKVLVSFTAQKMNKDDFSTLAGICAKHKVDKLWWDRVVSDDTKKLALSTEEFKSLVMESNRLRNRYRFLHRGTVIDTGRALQFINAKNPCYYRCSAGGNLLIFLANGDVMPCRRLPFVIGNLQTKPLEEIVEGSSLLRQLRETPPPEACRTCRFLPVCGGGAKCVTFAQTGNLFMRDVNCFL